MADVGKEGSSSQWYVSLDIVAGSIPIRALPTEDIDKIRPLDNFPRTV
jgi:hypothetical protein